MMTKKEHIYVKPATEGLVVRMPERNGNVMPTHGAQVPNNLHYQRRKADGDLVPTKKALVEGGDKEALKTAGKDVNERFKALQKPADEKPTKAAARTKASAKEQ